MGNHPPDIEIRYKPESEQTPSENTARPQPPLSEAPRSRSFAPSLRPRSIFTLRPFSHTEQPPAETEKPIAARGSRRMLACAAVGLIGGVALVAWSVARGKPERASTPIVLVNGTPRVRQTTSGAPQRWAADREITIVIDQSIDALGKDAREAVMSGFGTWLGSGAALPKLRFDVRRQAAPKLERDGISSVLYAPIDVPGHTHDLAITIGFADPDTGRIVEADVVINRSKSFGILGARQTQHDEQTDDAESADCAERYDLQNVITHEVGHFFGLGEDEEDRDATMFFKTNRCELKKRDLGADDSSTLVELYAPDEAAAAGAAEGAESAAHCATRTPSRTSSGPAAWLPFALLLCALVRIKTRSTPT